MTHTDPYAVLQVTPDASAAEVAAAYEELQSLYSPERYVDGPPEFAQLAANKRRELATAYAAVAAGIARSSMGESAPHVDFRPLPPARGQERSSPVASAAPSIRQGRSVVQRQPMLGMAGLLAIVAIIFLLVTYPGVRTYRGDAAPTPVAASTLVMPGVETPFSATEIEQLRRTAERAPSAESWTALGNALFDNLETLREAAPQSEQYRNAANSWTEASSAYEAALQLRDDPSVRISLSLTLLYYGNAFNDRATLERGWNEAQRAQAAAPDEPAVALRYGLALVALDPPRTAEAVQIWRALVERAPQTREAQQAAALLQSYDR